MRGHKRKSRKGSCLNKVKKYSFSLMNVDTLNGLKEGVIMASCVI